MFMRKMNVNEEPIEIKVEPEINDILPFEDFDIDQFVDYLQNNDDIVNNHESSTPIQYRPPLEPSNSITSRHHSESSDSQPGEMIKEKLFYTCTVCHEIIESGHDLLKHVRTHTRLRGAKNNLKQSSNAKFCNGPRCCICSRLFNDNRELWRHEKMSHQPPFKCRICDLKFSRLKILKSHISTHKRYQFVPDSRNLKSNSVSSSLSGAYKVQTSQGLSSSLQNRFPEPQIIRCRFCSKPFVKKSHLRKHEALHEINLQSTTDIDNSTNSGSKALTLTPSLLSNLNKLANLNSSDPKDGKKPAILININTSGDATNEMKSQENPVVANSSGLLISSVSSIDQNHFDKIDKNEKHKPSKATVVIRNGKQTVSLADVQCPICKKIVSQPFSLKVHLRTHTQEKPYKCSICEKRFSQSCNLRTHMKTHSSSKTTNQEPLECNICRKVFTRAASLNNHMMTHNGKLFCYACSVNFNGDYIAYAQHMQKIHFVAMTNDLMLRATTNVQKLPEAPAIKIEKDDEDEQETSTASATQQRVFEVQSSSVTNGQIPKLKITLKRDPILSNIKKEEDEGNESDSSTSSSSSNSSSSSTGSESSNSSSSSSSSNDQDNNNNSSN